MIIHQYLQLFYTNTSEYHHQQAETFWLLGTLLCSLIEKAADSISVLYQLHLESLDIEALCEFHSSLSSVIYHRRLLSVDVFLAQLEIFKGLPSGWIFVCGQVGFQSKCVKE